MKSRPVFRQRRPKDVGDREIGNRVEWKRKGWRGDEIRAGKGKEHRVARHLCCLYLFLRSEEQESPPPRQRLVFAKDEAALHHPLRIEILLTPLKVRFTFRSLITFRTCLFFFYIPRPPFNRLASDYDPSPPLPSPLNLSETRRSTIPLLIVVFIFIRKYLNFTGSSSGNYCLSRPPSELPPVSLSLSSSLFSFAVHRSRGNLYRPVNPSPPLLVPRNWNRYINWAGAQQILEYHRIPSFLSVVGFIRPHRCQNCVAKSRKTLPSNQSLLFAT